jgi:uncharacterized alkaline shock family protein YloU
MKERKGFYIQLNDDEVKIVAELKTKYAVNISQLLKNALRECHERMTGEKQMAP